MEKPTSQTALVCVLAKKPTHRPWSWASRCIGRILALKRAWHNRHVFHLLCATPSTIFQAWRATHGIYYFFFCQVFSSNFAGRNKFYCFWWQNLYNRNQAGQ